MKLFLILLVFTFIACDSYPPEDYPPNGFTNRWEAKNKIVNGEKEGKWVQYGFLLWVIRCDTLSYTLTVFKHDVPDGPVRKYYMNGHLEDEYTYVKGKIEGVSKEFYKSGALRMQCYFKEGHCYGSAKTYYEDGTVETDSPYVDGKETGIEKDYHYNGKLKSEITYYDGVKGPVKNYDEDGK